MKTNDFDYSLPPELIAQTPIEPRSQSRLMVVNRSDGSLTHHRFFEMIDYLRQGDVLVFNNSLVIPARLKGKRGENDANVVNNSLVIPARLKGKRGENDANVVNNSLVIPARLKGRRVENEGKIEILLLRRLGPNLWETLVKPGRRIKVGTTIEITGHPPAGTKPHATVTAEAVSAGEGGSRVMKFSDEKLLPELGEIPLPPYIRTPLTDPGRYQTVYADVAGSVAAPTAGLHFTPELIDKIKAKGIRCLFTTLHIGLDTFQPVREDDPLEHKIHKEYGVLSQPVADELSKAKREGRRIICVGTTAARLIESAAKASRQNEIEPFAILPNDIQPFAGWVDLFILPGHRFRAIDALITNFHLPRSTLLMLVTAFAGKELIDNAYRVAISEKYRFYSFGDAMLIL